MRQHTAIGCTLVMAVLGLAGCATLNDVVQEKNQGGWDRAGLSRRYRPGVEDCHDSFSLGGE